MSLIVRDGKLLLGSDGKLTTNDDCCCDPPYEPCCVSHKVTSATITLGADPSEFCCSVFVGTWVMSFLSDCTWFASASWPAPPPGCTGGGSCYSHDYVRSGVTYTRWYYIRAFRMWIYLDNDDFGWPAGDMQWRVRTEVDMQVTILNHSTSECTGGSVFTLHGSSNYVAGNAQDFCEPGTTTLSLGSFVNILDPALSISACNPDLNIFVQIDPI